MTDSDNPVDYVDVAMQYVRGALAENLADFRGRPMTRDILFAVQQQAHLCLEKLAVAAGLASAPPVDVRVTDGRDVHIGIDPAFAALLAHQLWRNGMADIICVRCGHNLSDGEITKCELCGPLQSQLKLDKLREERRRLKEAQEQGK